MKKIKKKFSVNLTSIVPLNTFQLTKYRTIEVLKAFHSTYHFTFDFLNFFEVSIKTSLDFPAVHCRNSSPLGRQKQAHPYLILHLQFPKQEQYGSHIHSPCQVAVASNMFVDDVLRRFFVHYWCWKGFTYCQHYRVVSKVHSGQDVSVRTYTTWYVFS